MKYILITSVYFFALWAHSQDTISVSRALRIDESIKIAAEMLNRDAVEQVTDFHNSMLEYQKIPTKSQQEKLSKLLAQGIEEYRSIINVEKIHNVWIDDFHSKFTDKELLEIMRFAGSPIGKKLFSEMNNSSRVIDKEISKITKRYAELFDSYDKRIEDIFAE